MLNWAKKHVHHKHSNKETEPGSAESDTGQAKKAGEPITNHDEVSKVIESQKTPETSVNCSKIESEKSPSFSRKFASLRKMATGKISVDKKERSKSSDKSLREKSKSPEKLLKTESPKRGVINIPEDTKPPDKAKQVQSSQPQQGYNKPRQPSPPCNGENGTDSAEENGMQVVEENQERASAVASSEIPKATQIIPTKHSEKPEKKDDTKTKDSEKSMMNPSEKRMSDKQDLKTGACNTEMHNKRLKMDIGDTEVNKTSEQSETTEPKVEERSETTKDNSKDANQRTNDVRMGVTQNSDNDVGKELINGRSEEDRQKAIKDVKVKIEKVNVEESHKERISSADNQKKEEASIAESSSSTPSNSKSSMGATEDLPASKSNPILQNGSLETTPASNSPKDTIAEMRICDDSSATSLKHLPESGTRVEVTENVTSMDDKEKIVEGLKEREIVSKGDTSSIDEESRIKERQTAKQDSFKIDEGTKERKEVSSTIDEEAKERKEDNIKDSIKKPIKVGLIRVEPIVPIQFNAFTNGHDNEATVTEKCITGSQEKRNSIDKPTKSEGNVENKESTTEKSLVDEKQEVIARIETLEKKELPTEKSDVEGKAESAKTNGVIESKDLKKSRTDEQKVLVNINKENSGKPDNSKATEKDVNIKPCDSGQKETSAIENASLSKSTEVTTTLSITKEITGKTLAPNAELKETEGQLKENAAESEASTQRKENARKVSLQEKPSDIVEQDSEAIPSYNFATLPKAHARKKAHLPKEDKDTLHPSKQNEKQRSSSSLDKPPLPPKSKLVQEKQTNFSTSCNGVESHLPSKSSIGNQGSEISLSQDNALDVRIRDRRATESSVTLTGHSKTLTKESINISSPSLQANLSTTSSNSSPSQQTISSTTSQTKESSSPSTYMPSALPRQYPRRSSLAKESRHNSSSSLNAQSTAMPGPERDARTINTSLEVQYISASRLDKDASSTNTSLPATSIPISDFKKDTNASNSSLPAQNTPASDLTKDTSTSIPSLHTQNPPSVLIKDTSASNTSLFSMEIQQENQRRMIGGSLPASPSAPKRNKRVAPVPMARSLHGLNNSPQSKTTSDTSKDLPVPKPRTAIALNPFNSEDEEEQEEEERKTTHKGIGEEDIVGEDRVERSDRETKLNPVPAPRKIVSLNPFDSDEDDEEEEINNKKKTTTSIASQNTSKPVGKNPFEDDEDEEPEDIEFAPKNMSSPAKNLNKSAANHNSSLSSSLQNTTNPFDDDDDDDEMEDSTNDEFQRGSMVRQSCNVTLPQSSLTLIREAVGRSSLPPSQRSHTAKKKRQAPLPPGQNPHTQSLSRGSSISSLTRGGSNPSLVAPLPSDTPNTTSPRRPPPPRPPPPKKNCNV